MGDIVYGYGEAIYLNITNQCPCRCTFCVRTKKDALGSASNLWHEKEPSLEEIKAAVDAYDLSKTKEIVFCGYGEPTVRIDVLTEISRYIKENYHLPIRVNTNGLGNLVHGRAIEKELCEAADSISISLNMPDAKSYQEVVRSKYGEESFDAMLDFAVECKKYLGDNVKFSVVDVIGEEAVEKSRALAEKLGIPLRVRVYSE